MIQCRRPRKQPQLLSVVSGKCVLGIYLEEVTDEFYGIMKSRKRSVFVIDSYLKDSAFTAVKSDVKF